MAEWTIRRAVAHDAIPLERCIDGAYARYRDRIPDLPSVSEGVADDISSNLVWVAELDRKVVGGLILVLNDEHAILANIAVDPDYKGMGIGRGLIERAEVHCRKLKKAELRLSTHIDMPENVRLYEHLGWIQIESSGNKVRMTKLLLRIAPSLASVSNTAVSPNDERELLIVSGVAEQSCRADSSILIAHVDRIGRG